MINLANGTEAKKFYMGEDAVYTGQNTVPQTKGGSYGMAGSEPQRGVGIDTMKDPGPNGFLSGFTRTNSVGRGIGFENSTTQNARGYPGTSDFNSPVGTKSGELQKETNPSTAVRSQLDAFKNPLAYDVMKEGAVGYPII